MLVPGDEERASKLYSFFWNLCHHSKRECRSVGGNQDDFVFFFNRCLTSARVVQLNPQHLCLGLSVFSWSTIHNE